MLLNIYISCYFFKRFILFLLVLLYLVLVHKKSFMNMRVYMRIRKLMLKLYRYTMQRYTEINTLRIAYLHTSQRFTKLEIKFVLVCLFT